MGIEMRPGLSRRGTVFAVLGIVAALALLGFNWLAGAITCGLDTSYCADSTKKHGLYRGVLEEEPGTPYAERRFSVTFESRQREDLPAVSFVTGERGEFCIQWPQEAVVPFVNPPGLRVAGQDLAGLRDWVDVGSDYPVPGCQMGEGGIPWDRAETLRSSWQYRLLIGLPSMALAMLVAALASRRTPRSPRRLTAGLILLAGSVIATPLMWM